MREFPRHFFVMASVLICLAFGKPAHSQDDDYLSDGEITAVRDAQEPEKRLILYMNFAQSRIDGVKGTLGSAKPNTGRDVQKHLIEYVRIMEDVDSTIEDARDRRVPLRKAFTDVVTRGKLFLNYLKTLDSKSSPGWKDYQYTLDEAVDMTEDEIAEAAKGDYPEVKERKPPNDLPSVAPRPPADAKGSSDAGSKAGQPQEEGPPRKSRSQ